jgi:hypothetical protein
MLAQAWLWKERNGKTKISIHYHTWQNLLTSLGVSISLCDPTSVHESRNVSWFGPWSFVPDREHFNIMMLRSNTKHKHKYQTMLNLFG